MSKLMALAVHGDAFVHQRSNGIMLIDGGGSSATLGAQLTKELPTVSHLDVVVCTHADLDHANGLKTILTDWRVAKKGAVTIGEFWLPGRWLDVARRGLGDPRALMSDLIRALDQGRLDEARLLTWSEDDNDADDWTDDEDVSSTTPVELSDELRKPGAFIRIDDPDARTRAGDPADPPGVAEEVEVPKDPVGEDPASEYDEPFEPNWLRDLREKQDSPDQHEITQRFGNARARVVYRMGKQPNLQMRGLPRSVGTTEAVGRYCLALIDAAEAIVRIARHAIDEKVPIRWFDQDKYATTLQPMGGKARFLLPMNSVEPRSMPVAVTPPTMLYLTLSKANRESLAFYSPAEPDCHGVVFCADSRLGTGRKGARPFKTYPSMLLTRQLGTAPHHAAESAAPAYAHSSRFGITDWICAANGRTEPGPTFRGIATNRRCCTACPLIGKSLAAVAIDLQVRSFAIPNPCTCR